MNLPSSCLIERATIATQTDIPNIPILPLAEGFYDHVSVTHHSYKSWCYHTGTQTEALREPITKSSLIRTSIKRILNEFNEEAFSVNPKKIKKSYIDLSLGDDVSVPKPKRTIILNNKYDSIQIQEPLPPVDNDKIPEPCTDPRLGKVSDTFMRRMRMIAVIDHYEQKGVIAGLHIKTLQVRYARDFTGSKKYSLSGIRELLRSRGFGVNKKDCVTNWKK